MMRSANGSRFAGSEEKGRPATRVAESCGGEHGAIRFTPAIAPFLICSPFGMILWDTKKVTFDGSKEELPCLTLLTATNSHYQKKKKIL